MESGIATTLLAAWNAHDVDGIVGAHAPACRVVDVAQPKPVCGRAALRTVVEQYLQAFPDLHITTGRPVVEGSRCAIAWVATGTHRGGLLRVPATGRPVTVRGTSHLTFDDELIVEAIMVWDVAGWLRAVGLLPDL